MAKVDTSASLFLGDLPTPREEQFRMRRLQVFNWGTFCGLHEVPIAERGFLFVGRSGSGKSTLLDAMSALLVPPALVDFNAAAREAERSGRDRSLVSYVRGAWADQHDEDSGEVATQYLRRGPVWSALALEYQNALGRCVTLVRLLWMRGNSSTATDVQKHFIVAERSFDLAAELEGFDLDLRRLKQRLGDVYHHDSFSAYAERFRRLLGIGNDTALRLLHKTQSAKNLGDLNHFLRDFMLERPETFAVADRLVAEFAELDEAHKAVVTAREQIETLAPARTAHDRLMGVRRERSELDELLAGMDGYRERQRLRLLDARLTELDTLDRGLEGEEGRRQQALEQHQRELGELEARHREQGGERIEQLQRDRDEVVGKRETCLRHRGVAEAACRQLDWPLAATPQGFAEQLAEARSLLDAGQDAAASADQRMLELGMTKKQAELDFAKARAEIAVLEKHPSNMPAHLQALRSRLCAAVGLAETALPFAGELIQVRADEQPWSGAIERLLHGFALSLLVDERYYAKVAAWVDATHLGGKLVYHRIGAANAMNVSAPPRSVIHKLELAPHAHQEWLHGELLRRYDYACVDNVQALQRTERAITAQGQIKHGRSRHEKDDRHAVDDRRQWALGFDNRAKLALYKAEAGTLARQIANADHEIALVNAERKQQTSHAAAAQSLANLRWSDIDVAPLLTRLDTIEAALNELREGNTALRDLGKRIEVAEKQAADAKRLLDDVRDQRRDHQREHGRLDKERARCAEDVVAKPLTPLQQQGLDTRCQAGTPLTLGNLAERTLEMERALNQSIGTLEAEAAEHTHHIVTCFETFRRRWAQDAGDVQANLESAADFFSRLDRLERDGLPAHEARFFEMLRTQSGQNLVALQQYIKQAHTAIRARLEDVNASLETVPFNRGSILQIKPEDRRLPEVVEFRQQLATVLGNQKTDDHERAEAQFEGLRKLVARLASTDPEHKRWREQVLDVRLHVEFIGEELDAQSGRQLEVYRSGAGKSGGQRQKLATTCLAAALRYQLGDDDGGLPQYAAVVLDEAFDKADNEFTAMAMRIFENFGFQMIVATPLKSVMTLEPFIGGACFVEIDGRHDSRLLMIEYDPESQRLNLPRVARESADAES
ncbi:ATP-binding protein [Frateuria edaphi]|uniref:ATP-binding protein n=1 Tax=Frateuria edaphi TaxID=2898793 RepID=UPI001E5427B8|nr:SbcC/MukB-like Walker B domain-containing protein [Frateuria edaphi]UGB45427.1 ATP-binding protein [Frateuria edaphi]